MTTTQAMTGAITHTTVDTPFGPLLLAGTDDGLIRIAFEREGFVEVLDGLTRKLSARLGGDPEALEDPRRQLEQYFAGERSEFTTPLDWRLVSGFRREALEAMAAIPYGETITYRELAAAAGNPSAVRAAGHACATNPWPVIVPCHRVLRTGGGLGGYLGGLDMKRGLLALERAGAA